MFGSGLMMLGIKSVSKACGHSICKPLSEMLVISPSADNSLVDNCTGSFTVKRGSCRRSILVGSVKAVSCSFLFSVKEITGFAS